MANEFYIAEDLLVRFYLPTNNAAVWNGFQWDVGGTWGSTDAFTWVDVVAEVTGARVEYGSSVVDGFIAPLEPNKMNVTLQSVSYDPFNNANIRAGTYVGLWYRQNPDTAPSIYTNLFLGKVDTLDVTYDPINTLNSITIDATSSARDFVNKMLSVWDTTSSTFRGTQLAQLGSLTGFTVTDASSGYDYVYAVEYKNDILVGDVLEGITTTERAMVYQEATNNNIIFRNWKSIADAIATTSPDITFSNTHSTDVSHGCVSDISLTYDADKIYNVIKGSLDIVPSTTGTRRLADSIAMFGERSTERVTHLSTSGQLTNWLNNIPDSYVGRRVNSITTPVIRRDRKLTDLARINPTDVVGVNLIRSGYTVNENLMITKVIHEITPTNWLATLELWKGF